MIVPLFLGVQKWGFLGIFGFLAKTPKMAILVKLAKITNFCSFLQIAHFAAARPGTKFSRQNQDPPTATGDR